MCKDSLLGDLVTSRTRWYDFPARLLLHRPMRCRMCNSRQYVYFFVKPNSRSEYPSSHAAVAFFPSVLAVVVMYLLMIAALAGVGWLLIR
ncbi:MAG TPA: hypothetical protein VNQ76_20480 [Planctomicrobium sp.]|nr:hypothetical protein [Planctomicrobium sp.]